MRILRVAAAVPLFLCILPFWVVGLCLVAVGNLILDFCIWLTKK